MKKIILLFLGILNVLTIVSCKKEKEDINTPKEFKTGDIVTSNGVIYQYIDVCKDIETLEGEEAKEYIFEEEENYKAYYNYYYLDMSNYKNQPKLREDKSFEDITIESIYEFDRSNNPNLSPITPYAFYLPSYLDIAGIKTIPLNGSFIVKGYTEDLPENVIIPEKIHGKYVSQIGYRAFDNAPMVTLEWTTREGYIHPYAITKCNQLKKIIFNKEDNRNGYYSKVLVMSMGISNCDNLELIEGFSPTMDCSLCNLKLLKELRFVSLFLSANSWMPHETAYGLGGIRKSFFYNCPNLNMITGINESGRAKIGKVFNTFYFTFFGGSSVPLYVLDNYTVVIEDITFKSEFYNYFTVIYNPETLEAYVPFLNDGLEKTGTILFKNTPEGTGTILEDDTGIYINATYRNPKYNAKLLFKRR